MTCQGSPYFNFFIFLTYTSWNFLKQIYINFSPTVLIALDCWAMDMSSAVNRSSSTWRVDFYLPHHTNIKQGIIPTKKQNKKLIFLRWPAVNIPGPTMRYKGTKIWLTSIIIEMPSSCPFTQTNQNIWNMLMPHLVTLIWVWYMPTSWDLEKIYM